MSLTLILTVLLLTTLLGAQAAPKAEDYFAIQVVDAQTGRGVPLVELTTVNDILYVTDSNGLVAFYEPGLMGRKVFFHVRSHGYEFPKDGFGNRGQALETTPGGQATLELRRLNVAERLYRITGAGIYRDTVLLGRKPPTKQPLLNGMVLGQDSTLSAVYRGKIYWFWGDTNRPGYPLGNFHMPGATSPLPRDGGLDPAIGVNLEYFLSDKGFAKETCRMPGDGPTWVDGLVVLRDTAGRERLFGAYAKIRPPMETYQRGIVVFNDEEQRFDKVGEFALDAPAKPAGHPFKHTEDGVEYVYFATACPLMRVRATVEDYANVEQCEAYTCLQEGARLDAPSFDRDAAGRLRYSWKKNTPPVGPQEQAKFVKDGSLKSHEALLQLRDVETGDAIITQHGCVYFNAYRRRWVMIVCQIFGKPSFLGETWCAEADAPTGPWVYARRIITHDKYTFYNPKRHPMLDAEGGRVIYLEGTYCTTFSGAKFATPRYNYNQIMYRLDLGDERLALPVPVYRLKDGKLATRASLKGEVDRERIACFALDRPRSGAVAVFQNKQGWLSALKPADAPPNTELLFYALPADSRAADTTDLLEIVQADGTRSYVTGDAASPAGAPPRPVICRVWRNPFSP